MIEISWELVTVMSALCLSWSLWRCWFGLFLHWAFTAGLTWQLKEQHTEFICLHFIFYFILDPGLPPEQNNQTHPSSKDANSLWLLPVHPMPWRWDTTQWWAFFLKHLAKCSLISVASQTERGATQSKQATYWNCSKVLLPPALLRCPGSASFLQALLCRTPAALTPSAWMWISVIVNSVRGFIYPVLPQRLIFK